MKITLNCVFKTPKGEQAAALLFLNRTSERTWYSTSNWIGAALSGDTESAALLSPEIYLKDGRKVVGLVKPIGIDDIMTSIGDTGTGKFYSGVAGRYPIPLDFNWECVEAQGQSTLPPDFDEDAVYLPPFRRPAA